MQQFNGTQQHRIQATATQQHNNKKRKCLDVFFSPLLLSLLFSSLSLFFYITDISYQQLFCCPTPPFLYQSNFYSIRPQHLMLCCWLLCLCMQSFFFVGSPFHFAAANRWAVSNVRFFPHHFDENKKSKEIPQPTIR